MPGTSDGALRRSIELFRKGDMAGGDREKVGLADPVERSLSEWVAVRFGWVGFDRIAAFTRYHPDWPVMAVLSRRAEEALLVARKPPAVVRAFFAERRPTGAAGKVALALALKSDGLEHEAAALVRDAWRNDTFGRELEARILGLFPGVLTQVDHRDRMERFLFREDWASALKAAGYAGNDYVLLAKARIAVGQEANDPQRALDAVPPSLRYETSYLFATVRLLRRRDKLDEAVRVLADVSRDPDILADGDGWWVERRLIARELLDRGNALAAYAVAQGSCGGVSREADRCRVLRRLDRTSVPQPPSDGGPPLRGGRQDCRKADLGRPHRLLARPRRRGLRRPRRRARVLRESGELSDRLLWSAGAG